MRTTIDFLDAVKAKLDLPSDYAAAKVLGVTRAAISSYRVGRSHFDADIASRVAAILDIDPLEVIASAEYERARTESAKAIWAGLLRKISSGFRSLAPRANARRAMLLPV